MEQQMCSCDNQVNCLDCKLVFILIFIIIVLILIIFILTQKYGINF